MGKGHARLLKLDHNAWPGFRSSLQFLPADQGHGNVPPTSAHCCKRRACCRVSSAHEEAELLLPSKSHNPQTANPSYSSRANRRHLGQVADNGTTQRSHALRKCRFMSLAGQAYLAAVKPASLQGSSRWDAGVTLGYTLFSILCQVAAVVPHSRGSCCTPTTLTTTYIAACAAPDPWLGAHSLQPRGLPACEGAAGGMLE